VVAGTFADTSLLIGLIPGYSNGAVSAGTYLIEAVMPCAARLAGVQVYAATAGTGVGNTVVDVLVNGTSIYAAAGDKPTLAAIDTGAFPSNPPRQTTVSRGDRVSIQVASISSTGHARLMAAVGLHRPDRARTG